MSLALQIIVGGLFFGYLFLFGSIAMVVRGWKPTWFAVHHEEEPIARLPYRRSESGRSWIVATLVAFLLATGSTWMHRRIAPENPDLAKTIIEGVKKLIPPSTPASIGTTSAVPSGPAAGTGAIPVPAATLPPQTIPSITESFDLSVELTIDRSKPFIRQWRYGSQDDRIAAETQASEWLVSQNVDIFTDRHGRDRLTRDLAIISLIAFLRSNDAQWWEGHYHQIGSLLHFESDPGRKCAMITESAIRSQLRQANNLYAEGPLWTMCCPSLCLPVGSTFSLSSQSLVLGNTKYSMTFEFEGPSGINSRNPADGELTKLPNGEARFETRAVGIEVRITYFMAKLDSSEIAKYRKWVELLLTNARQWFSVPQ